MKLNRLFAILASGVVLFTACNDKGFLEEHTYTDDTGSFFQGQSSIEIALAAAYSNVQYMIYGNIRSGNDHNWILNGLGLDTFTTTSKTGNDNNDGCFGDYAVMSANNGHIRHWGDYMYKLANRANTVVDMIDEHPEIAYTPATIKNELRAEAVFLRAWSYRILVGLFGRIAYSEHMTQEARYDYELISREEAWEKIAADFEYAEATLPAKPRLMGTVTKAAAAHYLAETYLALGEFKKAEDAATRVINKTDGDYELMVKRFGNRADQEKDRYGNLLTEPMGAYWDLFRSSGKTKVGEFADDSNPNDAGNKEAIWVAQIDYHGTDAWALGASGDSWWRMHVPVIEGVWAPYIPRGGKNGQRVGTDGKKYYVFTADATCFPAGVEPDGAGTPPTDIPEAAGRKLAWNLNTCLDSLAVRIQGNGGAVDLALYATEYVTRPYGDINGSVWNDPNDIRGSEIMIQRDYYTPSGKKWSEVKAAVKARVDAGLYTVTASDTVNITPRFWKFSDDRHVPSADGNNLYNDSDWYIVRIAETYLLRAEARLAQKNKSGAADDINVLRRRAGAADVSASEVNIDYILDERVRELFGEEERRVTLSRLSCNPKATPYISDCYPVQNETTSNTLYERTRKYGYGYEDDATAGRRETYVDKMGKTRHISNIRPYNYLLPIPIQIIQSNKDKEIVQNTGY